MHLVVRCLLIWLMALAVPLQGVAAANLRYCMPVHERMQETGTAHADGSSHAVPSHRHLPGDHASDASDAAHDAGPHDAAEGFKAGKCSACAACCVALGLPADAVQVPVVPADAFIARLRVAAPPSFVPGGLDRPPRTYLARR
jgi:hypothetical protein